ncbi:MAG: adenylyl-sulfate kinase [Desulfonauticus sp.]|nr:adenylyl-sulfate kinase [Desulfonauticus sp.]
MQGVNNNNILWHKGKINKSQRWIMNKHKSALIWFTGLPGSGKSTLSTELEYRLYNMNIRTYILDGDNIRHGLNKDLNFSPEDRRENLRRVGEVAKLFVDAGILTIAAFASPYLEDRKMVRNLFCDGEFIEVYVKCPLEICEQRDPKGLYKKARNGQIKGLTGLSAPYEPPVNPEIIVETDKMDVNESIRIILDYLDRNNVFKI